MNPNWHDSQIPELKIAGNNAERLKQQDLSIAVMDWDIGSGDDLIGSATLPLGDIMLSSINEKWSPIALPLFLGGQPAGELKFEILIYWEKLDQGKGQIKEFTSSQ